MAALVKVTQKFSILSGAEIATCGTWWFTATGDPTNISGAYEANAAAFWAAIAGNFPESLDWTETRYTVVEVTDGSVVSDSTTLGQGPGTEPEKALPPQCAMVLSIHTGFAGGSSRGRSYLPAVAVSKMTDVGRIDGAVVSDLVAQHATFFSAVQTDGFCTLGVYSRKNHAFVGADAINMGDVFDTQRSRRDTLVEARVSASL